MNKRKADKGIVLRMHLQNMAMGLAPVILFMPVALILHYMEQLGAWWVPLLFTYFAVYYTAQALILIPKHYTKLHHQLGSEMFYQLYPDEMKKALHRIRKTISPERELVIADYRSRMIDTDADERSRKRSTASAVLYTVAAAIVFVLAVFCLYRLIRGLQNGEKLNFARVLHFVSIFLMLTVSIALFRKWFGTILQVVTCVMLFYDIWANIANKLNVPVLYTMTPVYEALIVAGVYLVAGLGLPLVARHLNERARMHRNRQEFDLAMYELGVIDEKELAYRMEK